MDRLRTPIFLLACWLLLLALLIELGSGWALARAAGEHETPGIAIGYLALIDLMIIHTLTLMALQLVFPRSIIGRIQGPVTLILSIIGILVTLIVLVLGSFMLLMLMVTLLLAVPFGTIAYLAAWGHFDVQPAAATLLILMLLKIGFAILLPFAQQRFLKNKGLLFITGASIGLTWVIGFIHAFVPGFLVSIVDTLAALVIAVIGLVWLILLFIGSLIATVKTVGSARLG